MKTRFDAVLAKIATKRARRDQEGTVVEEPAVLLTFEVPVSDVRPGALEAFLRAVDREVSVEINDPQAAFEIESRNGETVLVLS